MLAELPFGMSPQWIDIAWAGSVAVVVDDRHSAAVYDPDTDSWDQLPNVPMSSYGGVNLTELDRGAVFAWDGYAAAMLEPGADTWLTIPTPVTNVENPGQGIDGIYGQLVSTGTEVFFPGSRTRRAWKQTLEVLPGRLTPLKGH